MSDGNVNIGFTSDATQVIKDQARVIKQQADLIDGYKKLAKEAKKGGDDAAKAAAAAAKELDRFAKTTKDINRTPLERYADEMRKLDQALKAGKIDQETFNRAVAKAKTEFEQAGRAGNTAFGPSATTSIRNYALGFGSLTAAVGVFRSVMEMSRAETDQAIQSVERLIETRGQLQQVAEGPGGADTQAMNDFADKLAMRGIPRAEAQSLIFSARSEGFTGQEDLIARLIAANQFKAADIRTLAGQVPTIFGGQVTPMQGIVGGAYGAKVSRLNMAEYAAMLPKGAQAGTILGGTPAESMALTAVLAGRSERSMEYAATLAGQVAYGKSGKEFQGLGVVGAVEKLSQMPEAQRREILGTGKEANLIYEWTLHDMPRIKEVRAKAQAAMDNASSYVADVESMVFDPTTTQGRLMRGRRADIQSGVQFEIGQEQRLAAGGYERRAATKRMQENLAGRGVNAFSRWSASKWMEQAESMQATPEIVTLAGRIGGGDFNILRGPSALIEAAKDLKDAAISLVRSSDRQGEAATELRDAAESQGNANRQRASVAAQPE